MCHGLNGIELAMLCLLTAGRTNNQISSGLFISPKTAGVHVNNIRGKLAVSVYELGIGVALQHVLVPDEPDL